MKNRTDPKAPPVPARRAFLVGLLTGGGAVAALASAPGVTAPAASAASAAIDPAAPILYRRSAEVERYYRTLYS
jgi:hypothetical protein